MKRTLILFSASLLFALIAGLGYVWSYQYLDLMRQEVFARESSVGLEKLQESRVESIRQLFAATSAEREVFGRYFVRQEEVAGVVSRLEKLGVENGVVAEVSGIGIENDASAESRGGKVRSVDITIQAVGSRAAAENYLKWVELFPYALSIKEVSLEKLLNTEGGGADRWRMAASLRIGVIR